MDGIIRHWVYGGFLAGILILALTPLIAAGWSTAIVAVFVQLPIYMIHQGEEHFGDRFRLFFNEMLAGGRDALTPLAVFVINIGGVWGIDLAALYLAAYVTPGWGLIAVDLALVNAVTHIGMAVAKRRYNPGLVTAIILFLPVGLYAYRVLAAQPGTTATHHIVSLLIAIAIHVAIMVYMRLRVKELGG